MSEVHAEPLAREPIFEVEGHARIPTELHWARGTGRLTFLWSERGPRDLWVLEPEAEEPRVLLQAGRFEHGGEPLDYAGGIWSRDGETLLIGTQAKDRLETARRFTSLFRIRLADLQLERLGAEGESFEDPALSPDGRWLAFVRDANLCVLDLQTGATRALTDDGEPGRILVGKPDWVYWEEIWHRRSIGFWWSHDSSRLAFLHFDETRVPTYPIVAEDGLESRAYLQRYPKAGDPNPRVRLGVATIASGDLRWLPVTGDDAGYVARVGWTADDDSIWTLWLDRGQDELALQLCDPQGGPCRRRLTERSQTWLDVGDDFALLADGSLVWGSDRDGWRRLYLYEGESEEPRRLTPLDTAVTRLEAVDESEGLVYYSGFRIGPLGAKDRELYRVPLAGGEPERLAGGTGWNSSHVDPDGSGWVIVHSSANLDPTATCVRRKGGRPVPLPSHPPETYDRAELPRWEFLTVTAPDGTELPARLIKPAGFDPTRRYPVIMHHYGGPSSQTVMDVSGERPVRDLWHLRQAQRGYVVFNLDNRASTYFGKRGAERLHRHFGEVELADQLAGVAYLKSLSWVDSSRIGLWGWSGGGANTLYAVLRSPGTWAAAVAGAPVTDWRLYDSIWTERYLGAPDTNPDGYRDSSAVTWAAELRDALLVVHGTADDNVHVQNTLALSHALVAAERPFEQALYPGEKHGFRTAASAHFYARMEAFFDRWLKSRAE